MTRTPNTLPGRKVATPAEVTQPGDWCIEPEPDVVRDVLVAAFHYLAPDGVKNTTADYAPDHIYVSTGEKRDGYWQWNGRVDAPTLSPSIWHRGESSWHGFFEAGTWRTL